MEFAYYIDQLLLIEQMHETIQDRPKANGMSALPALSVKSDELMTTVLLIR